MTFRIDRVTLSRLTCSDRLTYTRTVHRLNAIVLAIGVLCAPGQAAPLHIHAYSDHDHPEHHHGVAAHSHSPEAPSEDASQGVEPCDPGSHAVSLVFVCGTPPHSHTPDAEVVQPARPNAPSRACGVSADPDVRVHGPPRFSQPGLRAPPAPIPA